MVVVGATIGGSQTLNPKPIYLPMLKPVPSFLKKLSILGPGQTATAAEGQHLAIEVGSPREETCCRLNVLTQELFQGATGSFVDVLCMH